MIGEDLASKLVYSTVRLTCENEKYISSGTAFFMSYFYEDKNITALVTNKHVVCSDKKKAIKFKKMKFSLCTNENGKPKDDKKIDFVVDDLDKRILFHLDESVDLCFVFVNDLIEEKKNNGEQPHYKSLNTNLILKNSDASELSPIEDIIMIGYPNGLSDEKNNKPIIRKGITATSYNLDYNGKKEFMIDVACFGGSSGSPVFLRKTVLGKEKISNGVSIGLSLSYALLGVLYAGAIKTVDGKIVVNDISCVDTSVAKMEIMINLGYVIKPCRIMELFEQLNR